mmetsp:Transcript_13755/g.40233  ORF Transcript_13755/g.40233 Transcript_13755/m.40233 type:complete len:233 (-) Transcript_13755:1116-1814(-)
MGCGGGEDGGEETNGGVGFSAMSEVAMPEVVTPGLSCLCRGTAPSPLEAVPADNDLPSSLSSVGGDRARATAIPPRLSPLRPSLLFPPPPTTPPFRRPLLPPTVSILRSRSSIISSISAARPSSPSPVEDAGGETAAASSISSSAAAAITSRPSSSALRRPTEEKVRDPSPPALVSVAETLSCTVVRVPSMSLKAVPVPPRQEKDPSPRASSVSSASSSARTECGGAFPIEA